MYSIDDLLHLLLSEGGERLYLCVGDAPVIVLDGERLILEGPVITREDAELFLRTLANTRQRRDLREHGAVKFMFRFRNRSSFVVRARIEDDDLEFLIY